MEFFALSTLLFTVIAIVWLSLHYKYKRDMAKGISHDELHELEEMLAKVDKLDERIDVLEKILKEEKPNWRDEAARSAN